MRSISVMRSTSRGFWMEWADRSGDRAAGGEMFDGLVARELAPAYRTALLILRDPADAEDAVQDALVRAWQRWDQLREPSRARAWFGCILVNICRDRLRSPSRHVRWIGDGQEPDSASATVEREALARALQGMNADQRIALVLRYYLDLPVAEIAERTGSRVATVRSRLRLALAAARAAYEADERPEEQ